MENHENRARELLAQMTIDEKIAQLCALWIIIQENGELELRTNKGFILGADSEDPFTAMKHGIGQLSRPLGSQPVSPLDGNTVTEQTPEISGYRDTSRHTGTSTRRVSRRSHGPGRNALPRKYQQRFHVGP